MAKIKIQGDTKDAQSKIKALAKDLDKLEQKAKKPIKPNVKASTKSSVSAKEKSMSHQGNFGKSFNKKDIFDSTVKSNMIGSAFGGAFMKVIDLVLGSATELGKGFIRLTTGVSGLGSKLEKFQNALEIYNEPQKEALERADKIDALDDERRSHNTKTNAEEYGWSEAFVSESGANGQAVVDKLQSYLDMATSGDHDEMTKAWKNLNPIGIKWSEVEKGNTWEILAKMLKAYSEAGKDGMNELEPAFRQIFNSKQMGVIRKMGDGSKFTRKASLLKTEYDKSISPNESKILDAADEAEMIRAKAKIHDMAIPESGIKYIIEGAQHQLDSAKLNEQMLGDNANQIVKETVQQGLKDITPPNLSFSSPLLSGNIPLVELGKSLNNKVWEQARNWNDSRLDERLQNADKASRRDGVYKGLFHWDHKTLPNGKEQYTSFNPIEPIMRAEAKIEHSAIDAATKAIQNEINTKLQVGQYIKDLVNQLRTNTEATNRMNNTMQKNSVNSSQSINNNSSTAVFN